LDFFGSVQGVEIEPSAGSNGNDWKSDLEALRKIMERQRADLAAANETQNVNSDQRAQSATDSAKQGGMVLDMVHKSDDWAKKVAGLGSLLVLGGAWIVSNTMTKAS
jgi:hypothetical protein